MNPASVVKAVMSTSLLTTRPEVRAVDAALVIALHDITALPVLDGETLVGMFSETDLLRRTPDPGQAARRVGEVMSPVRLSTTPGTDLAELDTAMREHGVSSVPVLDGDRLVGVVTRRDLRPALPKAPT